MKRMISITVTAVALSSSFVIGDDRGQAIPGLSAGTKPQLIYSDAFEREHLADPMKFAGAWRPVAKKVKNGNTIKLKDGRLIVIHNPDVKHPLGLFYSLHKKDYLKDMAVYARFRLTKVDDSLDIGLTGENFTEGHSRICGLKVTHTGFDVTDTTGKGKHESRSVKTPIEMNTWHTVFLVIQGTKASVHIDEMPPMTLESKGLSCEKRTLKLGTKTGFEVDELKLWSLAGQSQSPPSRTKIE